MLHKYDFGGKNMKNLLLTCGSKNGCSAYISEKILAEIENIEQINISDMSINYCDGCLTCDDTGICHIKDDMNLLIGKVKIAETIIFITPVRWNLLSGNLKVFLDRLNPLAVPGILCGKKAAVFAVGQTNMETSESISSAIQSVKYFCDSADMRLIFQQGFGNCLKITDVFSQECEIENSIRNFRTILKECE